MPLIIPERERRTWTWTLSNGGGNGLRSSSGLHSRTIIETTFRKGNEFSLPNLIIVIIRSFGDVDFLVMKIEETNWNTLTFFPVSSSSLYFLPPTRIMWKWKKEKLLHCRNMHEVILMEETHSSSCFMTQRGGETCFFPACRRLKNAEWERERKGLSLFLLLRTKV